MGGIGRDNGGYRVREFVMNMAAHKSDTCTQLRRDPVSNEPAKDDTSGGINQERLFYNIEARHKSSRAMFQRRPVSEGAKAPPGLLNLEEKRPVAALPLSQMDPICRRFNRQQWSHTSNSQRCVHKPVDIALTRSFLSLFYSPLQPRPPAFHDGNSQSTISFHFSLSPRTLCRYERGGRG